MSENHLVRREFIKRAVYVTPAIFTLAVVPSFASAGSEAGNQDRRRHRGWLEDLLRFFGIR